jgi:hypothetical protein
LFLLLLLCGLSDLDGVTRGMALRGEGGWKEVPLTPAAGGGSLYYDTTRSASRRPSMESGGPLLEGKD